MHRALFELVPPSPKVHAHVVGLCVDSSVNVTLCGTDPDNGVPLNSALLLKVAVTDLAESMVIVHGLVLDIQSTVNPVKVEPLDATADISNDAPSLYALLQALPQSMPGLPGLVTVPLPVPALVTVRV
jgi:hypothetical protein